MKKIFLPAFLLSLVAIMAACNKTKSDDPALPNDRQEAVFITTDNNTVISYATNTGTKLWEVPTQGMAESTPVLYNKMLYVLTQTGFLYQIDVILGKIRWEKNIGKNGAESLAAKDGKLFVAADQLYCFDTLGVQKWNYDPGATCTSSPQLFNDTVYVAANDKIHAVNAITGGGVWISGATGLSILSSVRVSNGVIYFGCEDKKIYAINMIGGTPKWSYTTNDRVTSSPAVYGGMCIVGGQDFNIYCIDTTTGTLRWKYPTLERVISTPVIHEFTNSVLVGSYDYNLYCIDHVSGTLRWKYPSASIVKSSPVVYGNYVYFPSFDKYMYCVDVRDGRIVWKQLMNGNSLSSPVVDDLNNGIHAGISGMSTY